MTVFKFIANVALVWVTAEDSEPTGSLHNSTNNTSDDFTSFQGK